VHSETVGGWQRNIVHTFLADAPADALSDEPGDPSR
jgi:hypothetical protein